MKNEKKLPSHHLVVSYKLIGACDAYLDKDIAKVAEDKNPSSGCDFSTMERDLSFWYKTKRKALNMAKKLKVKFGNKIRCDYWDDDLDGKTDCDGNYIPQKHYGYRSKV